MMSETIRKQMLIAEVILLVRTPILKSHGFLGPSKEDFEIMSIEEIQQTKREFEQLVRIYNSEGD